MKADLQPGRVRARGASVTQIPSPLLQRKCACGGSPGAAGECAECEKKRLQRKADSTGQIPVVPPLVHEVLRSPGQPLGREARTFMEPRFGHDFSRVRVHTDSRAAESARSVGALAYTVGSDIAFSQGYFNPGTKKGKRLLAHELTHVIQQGHGGHHLQRLSVGSSGDPLEEEADRTADQVVSPQQEASPAKAPADPCSKTILAEGTCQHLATNSAWVCCDPENGFSRPGKTTSKAEKGKTCPEEKWTPLFTCDHDCESAVTVGCEDGDDWMAIPKSKFAMSKCDDRYTVCANGQSIQGYVRDKSEKEAYEVSPGIQNFLGVTVGAKFKGAIYPPGTAQDKIDADPCCHKP
jgi:hypothetical protein